MASEEEGRYEFLLSRIARVESLASLALVGVGEGFDEETSHLLRRYFRDSSRQGFSFEGQRRLQDEELFYLLERLSRRRRSRWEGLERDLSGFKRQQSDLNQGVSHQIEEFHGKLEGVVSSVDKLSQKNVELSAGTHEWLAIQSLGIDAKKVKISRFIPLRVYLSDTPENSVEDISNAIDKLLEAFDFEISDEFLPITGSWFKKWFAKTVDVATQPEVIERLQKIERAVELKGLGHPQAEIDQKQSEAVARLVISLEKIPNAAIQAGSILLIKITSKTGGPNIQARTLTQVELIHLENNQKLLASPADILEKLSELCRTSGRVRYLADH